MITAILVWLYRWLLKAKQAEGKRLLRKLTSNGLKRSAAYEHEQEAKRFALAVYDQMKHDAAETRREKVKALQNSNDKILVSLGELNNLN